MSLPLTGSPEKTTSMKKLLSHSFVLATPFLIPSLAFAQAAPEPEPAEPPPTAEEVEPPAATLPPPAEEPAPVDAPVEPAPEPEPALPPPPPEPEPVADEKPPEPSLSPIKFGTSTWSRFEVRENYDRLGVSRPRFSEGDQTVFRARIKMETAELPLVDGVTGLVNFTPQASGSWGLSGTGGTVGEANLGIYEGYFMLKSKIVEVKGGRFAMNYGDSLTIGNLDWNQAGRAFDGVHTHFILDKGWIDAFFTQQAEGHPAVNNPFAAGDSYFWGLYANIGGYIAKGLALEPYFLGLSTASTEGLTGTDATGAPVTYARDGATLFTLGARAQQNIDLFDYRVEGGFQFGESTGTVPPTGPRAAAVSTLAAQVEGEVGLTFGPARVGVGGFYATGNAPDGADGPRNEAYNELFPTGHKFLGWMDIIGARSNVMGGMLKLGFKLNTSLTADLHGHLFARPQNGGLGRTGADSFAGGEINAQLTQKIGKYVAVRPMYGIFIPNENHYAIGEPVHYFELQAGLNF